ncbi:MAG: ATP/GTP-binding protein [Bacteroidota bacterium]|nr:ATP/GTP-binding protein [Bacteroidota bacterium]
MKNLLKHSCIFLFFLFVHLPLSAQIHQLQTIWETDAVLKTPESVLYYPKGKFLFVSNIDGKPDEKDGKGSIGKIDLNGKIINVDWVSGLNAPKGMGIFQDKLFVADLTEVVVIDIAKEKIIQHIPVDSAIFLNDITIDKKGIVYVSDTRNFKVHKIENGKVTTFLENLQGPNGLLAVDDNLYILDRGNLLITDSSKKITKLADDMDKSTDGIEMVKPDQFVISCWSGIIYYVTADGDKQVLFDKRKEKINSADIGYHRESKTIFVPTFYGDRVIAYKLKKIIEH